MLTAEQISQEEKNKELVPYSIVRVINENKNEFTRNNSFLSEETANRISKLTNIAKSSINTTNSLTDIVFGTAKYSTSATLGFTKSLLLDILSTTQDIISKTENEQIQLNNNKKKENSPESKEIIQSPPSLTDALQKYFSFGAYLIHQSFSLTELLTLSTFNFTSQTVKFTLKAAEETVSIIDTLFGSTETSKIIASFVELLMKEFQSMPSLEKKKEQQQLKKPFFPCLSFSIIKNNPIEEIYNLGTITKALIAYACLQHMNYFRTIKYYEETDFRELESEKQCKEDINELDYSSSSSASNLYSDDLYFNPDNKKRTIIKKLFENITEIPEKDVRINNKKSTNLILSEMEKKQVLFEETKKKMNRLKTIKSTNDINNSIYYHEVNSNNNNKNSNNNIVNINNSNILSNLNDKENNNFENNSVIFNNKGIQEPSVDEESNISSLNSLDNEFKNMILDGYNDTSHIIEDSSMLLVKLSKNEIKEVESINFSKGMLDDIKLEVETPSIIESNINNNISQDNETENDNTIKNITVNENHKNDELHKNWNNDISCISLNKNCQKPFMDKSASSKNKDKQNFESSKTNILKIKSSNKSMRKKNTEKDNSILSDIVLSPILKNGDVDYDDPANSNDNSVLKEKSSILPPQIHDTNLSDSIFEPPNEKNRKSVCFKNDIINHEINNTINNENNNELEYNSSITDQSSFSNTSLINDTIANIIDNHEVKKIIKTSNDSQYILINDKNNKNNELSIYQNKLNNNHESFYDINKSTYLNIPYIPTGTFITRKRYQYQYSTKKINYRRRHKSNNINEVIKSKKLNNNRKLKNPNKSLLLSSDIRSYSLMNQFINPKKYYPLPNFLNNIYRYSKFVSASYGKTFMQVMKIGIVDSLFTEDSEYPENHYAFSIHTKVPLNCILLSSFSSSLITDSYIYNNKDPSQSVNVANIEDSACLQEIVYYLILDHKSKSLVLTLRGTLGLTDVLTDLTCNYLDIEITFENERNLFSSSSEKETHVYSVHSGMYYAAKWLAYDCKKLHEVINSTLKKYPKYGLVICGHSLGGGVASLLSVLWSIPKYKSIHAKSWVNTAFVTSEASSIVSGRPIYCYAYGCPSVMSLELSKRCKGLVTSIVNQYDLIPRLSVGLIKDIRNAINYLLDEKNDNLSEKIINKVLLNNANNIRKKENIQNINSSNSNMLLQPKNKELIPLIQNNEWLWNTLVEIRKTFTATKLSPPGTIYWINKFETKVKKTQSTASQNKNDDISKLYYRIKLFEVNPAFVSELVFAKTMMTDHSPNEYEKSIKLLIKSIDSTFVNPN